MKLSFWRRSGGLLACFWGLLPAPAAQNGPAREDFEAHYQSNRPVSLAQVAYPAYQFVPAEGWRLRAEGHAGATRLEGK
ncbi:MAG TPA: hypothetical protein VNT26_05725, partial [Candidatus Sulfotelmatobacter sp.]|nr:hypothetical protein [Candidatus Sulfotelmatobacter sp.]